LVTGHGATAFTGPRRSRSPGHGGQCREVVEGDPADVLATASERTPNPARNGEASAPALPRRSQNDPDPQVYDADPFLRRRFRRRLPLPAHLGQETRPRGALLREQVGAPVAVIPDRGGAHQRLGAPEEPRGRRRGDASPPRGCFGSRLPRGVPPRGRDVLPARWTTRPVPQALPGRRSPSPGPSGPLSPPERGGGGPAAPPAPAAESAETTSAPISPPDRIPLRAPPAPSSGFPAGIIRMSPGSPRRSPLPFR